MALMQLTVIPIGTSSVSVGEFVAECYKALQSEKDISFNLNDMGTVVEADDPTRLLAIAGKLHSLPFAKGVQRVITQLSIDDRRDKFVHIGDKIQSIHEKMVND